MSKEFYIHYRETIPWTEASARFGTMTYDDVLIKQENDTTIESRSLVNTDVQFGPYVLKKPIVTAPMDTLSGEQMIRAMHRLGAIGSLPRGDLNKNLQLCEDFSTDGIPCLYSVGLKNGLNEARQYKERGAQMVLVDIAHGGMESVRKLAGEIKNILGLVIVAGNITTYEQAESYIHAGIDMARVGVGAGSVCTTRIKTGIGFPQLSAVFETTESGIYVIADGGIRKPADVAKALAAGAGVVMIGGMFSGTEETPGEIINGKKIFRGQASRSYMDDFGVELNGQRTDEGIRTEVPYVGAVEHIVDDIMGGVRSAMTYVGAEFLPEFQERSQFVRISPATQIENLPHILLR